MAAQQHFYVGSGRRRRPRCADPVPGPRRTPSPADGAPDLAVPRWSRVSADVNRPHSAGSPRALIPRRPGWRPRHPPRVHPADTGALASRVAPQQWRRSAAANRSAAAGAAPPPIRVIAPIGGTGVFVVACDPLRPVPGHLHRHRSVPAGWMMMPPSGRIRAPQRRGCSAGVAPGGPGARLAVPGARHAPVGIQPPRGRPPRASQAPRNGRRRG